MSFKSNPWLRYDEDPDENDLDIELKLEPLEIIYRAETIGNITRFFKVKKLTD